MLRGMGAMEIGLILVIVLVVFGAGKLPQIGSALGKAIHDFRVESKGESSSDDKGTLAKVDQKVTPKTVETKS